MRKASLILVAALLAIACAAPSASATFPGGNGPIAFRLVDFATGLGNPLLRANPDGSGRRQLSDLPGFFSDWRADGRGMAFDFFDLGGNEQIATIDVKGNDMRVITSGPGIHEVPSWSPDARRIVFDYSPDDPSAPGFETRLWTMRSDGSHAKPVPMNEPGFDVEPRYSPSGRWIAFARLRDNGNEEALFLVAANGGDVTQLTPWGEYVEHPTWSPDSRWILFNTPDGSIEAIRPTGAMRHTIRAATPGSGGHKPWFSPDGRRILFMCENQGLLPDPPANYNEDICVMEADGSDVEHVTHTARVLENWPSWGPAPTRDRGD
jgi:TolB protein